MLSTPAWLSAGGHQCFAAMGMVHTKRSEQAPTGRGSYMESGVGDKQMTNPLNKWALLC